MKSLITAHQILRTSFPNQSKSLPNPLNWNPSQPRQILYKSIQFLPNPLEINFIPTRSLGNLSNFNKIPYQIFQKSIQLPTKSFRNPSKPNQILQKSIETLPNPIRNFTKINEIHYKIFWKWIKTLPNPEEILSKSIKIPHHILGKFCENQLNVSPTHLEIFDF